MEPWPKPVLKNQKGCYSTCVGGLSMMTASEEPSATATAAAFDISTLDAIRTTIPAAMAIICSTTWCVRQEEAPLKSLPGVREADPGFQDILFDIYHVSLCRTDSSYHYCQYCILLMLPLFPAISLLVVSGGKLPSSEAFGLPKAPPSPPTCHGWRRILAFRL